jgi:hypothetical protein
VVQHLLGGRRLDGIVNTHLGMPHAHPGRQRSGRVAVGYPWAHLQGHRPALRTLHIR